MGLNSVVQEVSSVFLFLRDVWSALPFMVQFLVYLCFGGAVLIAVMRSLWG